MLTWDYVPFPPPASDDAGRAPCRLLPFEVLRMRLETFESDLDRLAGLR